MANGNPRECTVQEYLESEIERIGGGTRRIKYTGLRGCADDLCILPWNRIFLVETKRPKGGKISIQQHEDAKWLLQFGVKKEYIYTKHEVDVWIARVRHAKRDWDKHEADCSCDRCIPL